MELAGSSTSAPHHESDGGVVQYIYDPRLREVLARRGVTKLMPVQQEAIARGLFYRQSFLVCAPSGSGKTLVGELAAAMAVLNRLGKAVYLVPYRALAAQKTADFTKAYDTYGAKVVLAMGDEDVPEQELAAADILVTTFEKLDAALRNARGAKWVEQVAVVVVDEIHEIGEPGRGPRLESLLVRFLQRVHHVQLVGLSATVGNPKELADWLGTLGTPVTLIVSECRPVPLTYEVVADPRKDRFIMRLAEDVVGAGGQVLVFTATRRDAEEQARKLMDTCRGHLTPEDLQKIQQVQERLGRVRGRNPSLGNCLESGVGFHHAGLDKAERWAAEKLFGSRAVKVIACTTTLAAGINTPARVVVLRGVELVKAPRKAIEKKGEPGLPPPWLEHFSYMYAFIPFPPNQVFQLLGRAGRPGYDTTGRGVILVSSDLQKKWAEGYYFTQKQGAPQPKYAVLRSQLDNPETLREQVLVRIHEAKLVSIAELRDFLEKSLFAFLRRRASPGRVPSAIDTFLRVTKATLPDILQLHAPDDAAIAAASLSPLSIARWQVSGARVEGEVTSLRNAFHCYFDAKVGPYCSCASGGEELSPSEASAKFLKKLCPHLAVLLKFLARLPVSESIIPRDIVARALKEESVVTFLLTAGFIRATSRVPNLTLAPTGFGSLTASLYLAPSKALILRDALQGNRPLGVKELLFIAISLTDEREETRAATVDMLEMWIAEEQPEVIVAKAGKSLGDLGGAAVTAARNLEIAASFADFFARPSVAHEARILALRVKHGVKEDAVDLASRIPGVGRARARLLVAAGYPCVAEVAAADQGVISARAGIPLKLAGEIVEYSRKLLSPPEALKD